MKEVLLHCCCAPCSSAIIEWMLQNDVRPTLFYCNPNIYPDEEYQIRKNELTRYAVAHGLDVIDDDYNHEGWLCNVRGLENEPEKGNRCLQCFKMRLLRTAEKCCELGFTEFTTTLASSRWKRQDQTTEAGLWAAQKVNEESGLSGTEREIRFDDRNWRKGGLQERRNQLLKENQFYNQLYCGCEFSLNPRLAIMSKDEIRKWIRELKKAHGMTRKPSDAENKWREEESAKVCQRVVDDGLWHSAGTVLLYHALPDEVDTQLLLENAVRTGKRVLLPKVCGDELTLHPYTSPDSLAVGAFGILEPTTEPIPLDTLSGTDILAIIPGVAFDTHCHRLGRGKGYYDRLLSQLHHTYRIGICFPFQLLDSIPGEEHDILMNEVVSCR